MHPTGVQSLPIAALKGTSPLATSHSNPMRVPDLVLFEQGWGVPGDPPCAWFFGVPEATALSCPLPEMRVLKVKAAVQGRGKSHHSHSGQKLKGEAREGGNRA